MHILLDMYANGKTVEEMVTHADPNKNLLRGHTTKFIFIYYKKQSHLLDEQFKNIIVL